MRNDTEMMAKVAEAAPSEYAYLMKTAEEVRQSPFRDEIVSQLDGILEKAANTLSEGAKAGGRAARDIDWGRAAKLLGGAAAAGVALNLGGDMYEAVKRGLTKGRHYKNMLESNPDLQGKKNAPFVKQHFNTLHKFNPEYASDPNVAGAWVRQHMDLGATDIQNIHGLVKARRDVQGSRETRPVFNPLPNY